ncbi:MAG: hypothetical protein KDC98_13300 [Planctomycetes bacterium]|nr:hypothetical protein [Planctomycetota bacterium]
MIITDKLTLAAAAAWCLSAATMAQAIPDRATLNSILSPNHTLETFEAFTAVGTIAPAIDLGRASLDSETEFQHPTAGHWGPNLVAPGATYSVGGLITWITGGTAGHASRCIGNPSGPTTGWLHIDYTIPVPACGLDVSVGFFWGGSGVATFKDPAGAVLGTVPFSTTFGTNAFVGWQSASGIGRVEISSGSSPFPPYSPAIDNHAYDIDASLIARRADFGTGCNQFLATVHQKYYGNSFDLANTSLRFDPISNGYAVTTGTQPVVTPTAAPIALGNGQVVPLALGWTFPHSMGSTSTLWLSSSGSVHMQPYTYPPYTASFELTNIPGPVFAARMAHLAPGSGGTVTFENDAVNGIATITFDQVSTVFANVWLQTFQMVFSATGSVEFRYGACSPIPQETVTGWSPGLGSLPTVPVDLSAITYLEVPGVDSRALDLSVSARPILGTTIDLTLDHIPAGSAIAAHVIGLSQTTPPLDLTQFGGAGCFGLVSPDAIVITPSPASAAVYSLVLPATPGLLGVTMLAQGLVYGPHGLNGPPGVMSSDALRLVTGTM